MAPPGAPNGLSQGAKRPNPGVGKGLALSGDEGGRKAGQDLIRINGEGKFQMTAAGRKTLGQISSVIRALSA